MATWIASDGTEHRDRKTACRRGDGTAKLRDERRPRVVPDKPGPRIIGGKRCRECGWPKEDPAYHDKTFGMCKRIDFEEGQR
jgi:hypothetical protein